MLLQSLACVLLMGVSLAGCSNSTSGQSVEHDGHVAFNGTGSGKQTSPFQCDGSGTVTVGGNVGAGSVTVTVRDASGRLAYSKTLTGPGQAGDNKGLSGSQGTWRVEAERSGTFAGQYDVNASC